MDEAERICDRVAIIDRGRVIAMGTPQELIASLGADQMIEFALAGSDNSEQGDWYNALPGVRGVRADNSHVSLTVAEPHVTIPALLEGLRERGETLQRLTTRHASLDDVFLRLTGRHFEEQDA